MGRNYFESGVSFSSDGHTNGSGEKLGRPYTQEELRKLDIFVPSGATRTPVDATQFKVTPTKNNGDGTHRVHGYDYQTAGVVLTPLAKKSSEEPKPHKRNGMILGGTSKKALSRVNGQMRAGR